ncbi:Papain family cysteine protease [Carpediemonas membranifera]|uniref:Papain family cysteine protease n=1 Tax=Carpediemonas membranifera TaxID=201153 RepID=A0A8J6B4H4_9EUKA|nr:Papain family cysteine protease [Carpediemonas membranifera]|eukprot:KAG9389847.1 Papain family cysteine protease [Carpediemonas membranifera]
MKLFVAALLIAAVVCVTPQNPCSSYNCRLSATIIKTDDPTTHRDVAFNIRAASGSIELAADYNNGETIYVPAGDGNYYHAFAHGTEKAKYCEEVTADDALNTHLFFILPFLRLDEFEFVGDDMFLSKPAARYTFKSPAEIGMSIYVDASSGAILGGETKGASTSYTFIYANARTGVESHAFSTPGSCRSNSNSARRTINGNHMQFTHEELLAAGATYHNAPEDYAAFSNGKTIDYTAGTTRFAPNILDQGMCGSCWTQAAATSIFGQIRKIKGANFPDQLLPSRQAIMDCAPGGDARGEGEVGRGCEGGNTPAALQWLQNVAIPTDTAYPYREVDHVCRIDQVPSDQVYPAGLITGVKIVPQYDEDALLHALETVGPISIVVCAGLEGFQGSNDRVQSTSKKCTDDQLDHAVTLVGAGVDGITGEEYWLVQNSWSYKWRDSGYIRIKRNAGNQYGVASLAAYPVLDASKIPFSTQ